MHGSARQYHVTATTYPLAIVVEERLELDDVWMSHNAHDLEFSVLHPMLGDARLQPLSDVNAP